MQTAVEWLVNHWKKLQAEGEKMSWNQIIQITELTKEMEKQQKEDFFNAGVRYGAGSVMATELGEDTEEYNFEQYYNKTFNK